MTEEIEDGNLITKTETFITFVILSSWRDTITVLKSCETLSPWAENLQIVRRCCDSIAWKASTDRQSEEDHSVADEDNSKLDELMASLRIDHFMRIITAMKARGSKPENMGKCIVHYAERYLRGINVELEGLRGHGYGKNEITVSVFHRGDEKLGLVNNGKDQKATVESLISILPPHLEAVPCKFLLKMLRTAILYSVTPALISDLEKRIALVLEDANVNDLLIPSYRDQLDQAKFTKSVPIRASPSMFILLAFDFMFEGKHPRIDFDNHSAALLVLDSTVHLSSARCTMLTPFRESSNISSCTSLNSSNGINNKSPESIM